VRRKDKKNKHNPKEVVEEDQQNEAGENEEQEVTEVKDDYTTDDTDTILKDEIDLTFFGKEIGKLPLPTRDPSKIIKALSIPTINFDLEPGTMTVLNFLYE